MESFGEVREEIINRELVKDEANSEASENKTLPADNIKPHAQIKLLSTTEKCKICNEAAARHVHYGATTCFSCRAFFRRTIQNNSASNYSCRRSRNCYIDLKNRKNCQFCRFKKCEEIGMKRNWVLSEEDRRKRFKSKNKLEDMGEKSMNSTGKIKKKRKYCKQINKSRSEYMAESEEILQIEKNIIHGLDLSSIELNNNAAGVLRIKRQEELQEKQRRPDQIIRPQFGYSKQQIQYGGHTIFSSTKEDSCNGSRTDFHSTFPINPFQDFFNRSQQIEGYNDLRRTKFLGVKTEQRFMEGSSFSPFQFGFATDNLQDQTETAVDKQYERSSPNEALRQQQSLENSYKHQFQQQFQQYAKRKVSMDENRTQRPRVIVRPRQHMAQRQHNNLFLHQQHQLAENNMGQERNMTSHPFMRQILSHIDTNFTSSNPRVSGNQISQNLSHLLFSQQEDEVKLEMDQEAHKEIEEHTASGDEYWIEDPAERLEVILNEPEIHFTEDENYLLATIVRKHNERYKSVNFGESLMKEFVMSAMFGIRISPKASMSGYKLQIERVTRISNNLPEFVGLTKSDQALLLKENADMLVSLRASLFFDKSKNGINQLLNCMGIDDIETTKMMFTTLTKENPMNNINYKAFNSIQTTSNEHVEDRNTFLQTKVAEMVSDEVSTILITYIILFSTDFCSLRDNRRIYQIQNTYIRILQRYLYSKYIRSKARSLLAGTLCAVTCVRELTDIKKSRQIAQNVQYTET